MSMLASWVLFPVLLGLLCLGCGLLLELVAGTRIPRPLLLPAGLAVVVVVAQLAISTSATIPLALPAVLVVAVAGIVLGRRRIGELRALHGARWGIAAAAGVFAVFAAPIVLSGQATFAGYIRLDDTSTWFALTDHALQHGRSAANLPLSTYGATLNSYLHSGYPLGAFLPLGIGHKLTGQDIAWLIQPYMAYMAAMAALCLYWIARRALDSRRLAALAAFTAAQAATLYGYVLWGGVKEVAAVWLVGVTAALGADAVRHARTGRAVVPVAVAFAAGLSALSIGGVVWLVPPLGAAVLIGFRWQRITVPVRQALVFIPAAAVLAIPAIATASSFITPASTTLTSGTELGNLREPLKAQQALGIWPAADFRDATVHPTVTSVLLGLLVASAILAVVLAWRRRAWELPLFVVTVAISCAVVAAVGSPWVDGKAYATASPAIVLAGMVGAAMIFTRRKGFARLGGGLLALVILGGVLWSNALAYRGVDLAPRAQLGELEQIATRFAGQGPTLMNDYEPYGARHFLRGMDAESVSELRIHVIPLRNGAQVPKGSSADLDRFPVSSILPYRTLVLHRSPIASRPPAGYALAWRGRYWEVWQRPVAAGPAIVSDLPLGTGFQPGAVPSCASVLRLAQHVPPGGTLAAVPRVRPAVVDLTRVQVPTGWLVDPARTGAIEPTSAGSLEFGVLVPRTGRYGIWLGGTFKSRVRVYIDGKLAATKRGVLEWEPLVQLGDSRLSGGIHRVRIVYDGPSLLHPGSEGLETGFGPFALSSETGNQPVSYLTPAKARSLCGKYLDWVEAIGPSGG
ncbi:MAG TPA: hypothetical protein VGI87_07440 [Solirubrobacteraceae bacterium]